MYYGEGPGEGLCEERGCAERAHFAKTGTCPYTANACPQQEPSICDFTIHSNWWDAEDG
jgi:hypothetical protein